MECKRKKAVAHRKNFGGTRPYSDIKYLVLHYTAVDGDSDEGNARYFQEERMPHTSAHYFVDDDSITNSVPCNYTAYAVGGKKYSDCKITGGGRLYGVVTNSNSISIEMCDTLKDGTHNASEKTTENTIMLCRELMKKYNIPIERVVRHFDVNGKHCPVYFMDEDKWGKFKEKLMGHEFLTGKSYISEKACYLRNNPGVGNNKVKYENISEALKKKCMKKLGFSVLKKGMQFRLMKVKIVGGDLWGKTKSGYWVPLVYKGKTRAKIKGKN